MLPVEVLAERLMLAIYAYGTNTGIRAVAAGGGHGHVEDEIRYLRRRYLTRDTAQAVAIGIANATFAARQQTIWGEGSTAVASDSTHFRSYDQNILTEWHSRYGGRGILIYWHVERGSMVVHSQTLRASASEVHAMVEGAIRHGTTMKVEGNYVDSHGQSEIGFGITRLLGFDLLPRIKQINKVRLYRPTTGQPEAYARLAPALTRPIRWDLVEQNYDQMIKYATAIRQGTASTEAILRRFTRSASHPTYQAMLEVGRAQRTIFVARYLRSRELQREITEGLNVVEAFNGANSVIYYGKGGEIASNRQDEQGDDRVVPEDLASGAGVREHPDAARRSRRTRLERHPHSRGPARADPAVLAARPALRRGQTRHQRTTGDRSGPSRLIAGRHQGRRTNPRGNASGLRGDLVTAFGCGSCAV